MRLLLPLVVALAALAAPVPAAATTTVTRSGDTLTITGDDVASTLRVTAPSSGTLAVEDTTGEGVVAGAGCAPGGSTVTCPSAPRITATLGGGNDDYKASVDPPQTVDGGAENDTIEAGYGNDTVAGGPGNDDLNGFRGNDTVDGQDGDDTVDGWDGNDTVIGGPGRDTLRGDGATIYAPGNDTVQARDGEVDSVDCGTGADSAVVDSADVVAGCAAVDRPAAAGPAPAPAPSPAPAPVPAPSPPTVRLQAATAPKLGRLARGTAVKVDVTASAACSARVRLRVSGKQAKALGFRRRARTLATSREVDLVAGRRTSIAVKLARADRKRLRRVKRLALTVAVTCGAGKPTTARFTLRR